MFYSHEILTSRKYGVATVWLVATLGAKSSAKKLTRKAILDVDVKKACKTIIGPEAPMALRLQSNLMFGVTQVYSQQCGYVLADAQSAQAHLRMLARNMKHDELDPEAGKARPDQLILLDDPAFMPDMGVPALDFDFSNLNLNVDLLNESQKLSLLSPPSQRRRCDSSASRDRSIININLPDSTSGIEHHDPFQPGFSSAQKISGGTDRLFGDEEARFIDEFDFVFDADGEIRDINPEERELLRSGGVIPEMVENFEGDGVAGKKRRRGQNVVAKCVEGNTHDRDGDYIMDEQGVIPEVAPAAAMISGDRARSKVNNSDIDQGESSLTPIESKQMARRRKPPKALPVDLTISLKHAVLREWQDFYGQNMLTATRKKKSHFVSSLAKEKANNWIFGRGIGGVGDGIGALKQQSPLAIFAGENLKSVILGTQTKSTTLPRKREREGDDYEPLNRNVRLKSSQDIHRIGRDDAFISPVDDLEVGREARAALDDNQVSAMPWNVSSSLHSYRVLPSGSSVKGPGTAVGRPSSILGVRPRSRLTSASPLAGRGRASIDSNLLDLVGLDEMELPALLDYAGILHGPNRTLFPPDNAADEFELFGPSAAVDTQTAQDTQWVRDALARESMNFLEFVSNTLTERQLDELGDEGMSEDRNEVGFQTLFPPKSNTRMVAAQAFHHVLTLATKDLLVVKQEEPFGEIYLAVKE